VPALQSCTAGPRGAQPCGGKDACHEAMLVSASDYSLQQTCSMKLCSKAIFLRWGWWNTGTDCPERW